MTEHLYKPFTNQERAAFIAQNQGKQLFEDAEKIWFENMPEPTLEELKVNKLKDINVWRETAKQEEYATYKEANYGIREIDQTNINSQVNIAALMLNGAIPIQTQPLRDVDNITRDFTPQEIISVGLAIGSKITQVYEHSWSLKEMVDNATTIEEVEAIKW